MPRFLALAPLFFAAACTVDAPPPSRGSDSPAAQVQPPSAPPGEPSPSGATPSAAATAGAQTAAADGEPTAAVPGPAKARPYDLSVQELADRLRQVSAILNRMKAAAREAAAAERTECGKSYASVTAAIEVSQRETAALGRRPPEWIVAPRAEYLRLCETLPEAVQRCSRYDYRADHGEECNPRMDELAPEQAAVVERMYRTSGS